LYEQSLSRLTPDELATHYSYLSTDRTGPAGADPTTVNAQAQTNMINPVTGLPNAIVTGLVPLANMLNITNPQDGYLTAGLPGAVIGNAAQAAINAQMAAIAEQGGGQPVVPGAPGVTQADLDDQALGDAMNGLAAGPAAPGGVGPGSASSTNVSSVGAVNGADAQSDAATAAANSNDGTNGNDPADLARGGLSSLAAFANGGYNLGDYSDGGRLLRGPGDGVSDSIPASIANKRPARLADGEFVVPARIVSELGNGSTEAGARKLYAMMDRVQKNRSKSIGKGKVAVNSRSEKLLPA
jgi:hypothetical protein